MIFLYISITIKEEDTDFSFFKCFLFMNPDDLSIQIERLHTVTTYDVVPKEEIAEFEELMRKTIADIASEASSVACWVYVQICETENSGRNAARIARSRPVYYCHGYLVRKTDGGIIEAMIE